MANSAKLPSRRRWPSRRDESGFTLIEDLVTIALLGTAIIALIYGLLISVHTSDLARKETIVDTTLRGYAEAVKSAVQITCTNPPANYLTAISYTPPTDPAGGSYTVSAVQKQGAGVFGDCPPVGLTTSAAAEILITAASPDNWASHSLTIDIVDP